MSKNKDLQGQSLCKGALRKDMLQRRKTFSMDACVCISQRIQQNIAQSAVWAQAKTVGLYMAKGREVQTQLLLETAWKEGKEVFLPRCHAELGGHMDFIYCQNYADLAIGAYNIQEPTALAVQKHKESYKEFNLDILLVPGVVFDTAGYRIGFGGGYYDRFLQRFKGQKTCCIGAAFSWQVLESIPYDAWDMPVHALATEEAMRWI